MIPSEGLIPACAALLLAGCGQAAAPGSPAEAERKEAKPATKTDAGQASPAAAPAAVPAAEGGPAPDGALDPVILKKETITVAGQPACALTVRYGDGEAQPVTWRGEACDDLIVRLVSIEDLRGIGQDVKLSEEARDDLARMPGGRAVYVEGQYSSALYPANVMDRVYTVALAD